jgi:peptidoglycan/LPS O-acetylase OafA/YrhL
MADERVSELDGMRGAGAILVVAYHIFRRGNVFTTNAVLHFFSGLTMYAWYSLDTFYVLSGFLIATILLRTKGSEHYYGNFYARRSLRVFPLYYFTLAFMLLLIIPKFDPEYLAEVPRALPFQLFYLNNFLHLMSGIRGTPYLAVTWSLAIEEHFYLPFPFLVYYTRKETLAKICGGIIGISILARILAAFFWTDVRQMTNFFFYNTFTRFEEIAFGVLVAIAFTYPEWRSKLGRIALPVFLIIFSALNIFEFATNTGIPLSPENNVLLMVVGYTAASVFAAALIIALLTQSETSVIRRIFRNKIFVFWGQRSYSIYLYHVPVGVLLVDFLWKHHYRGWYGYLIYIGLTFGITVLISMLTWSLLEKPMMNLKKHFEYK